MISKRKNYFTIFGMLAATCDKQMQSVYSQIDTIMTNVIPKIKLSLLDTQIKTKNQYLTNNI